MSKDIMKIESMKHMTKVLEIEKLQDSKIFYISLSQHIGQISKEIVKVGDFVKRYEKIGEMQGNISSPIHSPVSGQVIDIKEMILPNKKMARTVVIKNDFKDEEIETEKREISELENYKKEEILEIIKNSGIVGEGGAQFPTYVKYDIKNKKVKTFIINGAECEPYLTSDYSVMKNFANDLIKGIKIVKYLINPKNIVIGIEDENFELKQILKKAILEEKMKIKIKILPTSYPQGSELQLIAKITGKKIKKGELPINKGVVVSNVSTIKSIYDAFTNGIPLVERIVTVSGESLSKIGNYIIKIGTPLEHIIKTLEPNENSKIIFGGPMMGQEIFDNSTATIKGTSGILFLKNEGEIERNNCISCGYCVEVCPMNLMPLEFAEFYEKNEYKMMAKANIMSCIECGACEYACPSRVPLIESIKNGKENLIRMEGNK
jgi:electron transport complex, rnfABCDGE type, C subunit